MQDIKEAVKYSRPPQRCHKDIFFPKALILPDLALPSVEMESVTTGTVLSVELKPKQGYRMENNCVHNTLCNFCPDMAARSGGRQRAPVSDMSRWG